MTFYKITSTEPAADYLAGIIKEHLGRDEKVAWLVCGGSAIAVAVQASRKLDNLDLSNLFVTLTDERFVPPDNPESNWKQLMDAGLKLPGAQLLPVLDGSDIKSTTARYSDILKTALNETRYRIGLFGMGADGHIAALFPGFEQLNEKKLYAASLTNSPKPPSARMTMAPAAIARLDEAVIFARGSEKKTALQKLGQDLSPGKQPAQILKAIPKLTVYNDQIGESI